eukprot:3693948-Rhodomonas_salina.2
MGCETPIPEKRWGLQGEHTVQSARLSLACLAASQSCLLSCLLAGCQPPFFGPWPRDVAEPLAMVRLMGGTKHHDTAYNFLTEGEI